MDVSSKKVRVRNWQQDTRSSQEGYRDGEKMNKGFGLSIKPLSVNDAWQGKRFKTKKYKNYEKEVLFMLPSCLEVPKDCDLKVYLEFGFSNNASDLDNPVKPFVDILQKKYGFDDKSIVEYTMVKKKRNKGAEYILFNIEKMEQ
jgi:Holliday junction resolvase RusA-like endonuclease